MAQMKVMIVASVENHILGFHKPFIKFFQKQGYEVHIATKITVKRDEFDKMGVVSHDINFSRSPYSIANITSLIQLINIMKKNKYRLVHVHTPVAALLARLASKITNTKPVLYTAHGFHFYNGAPLKNWILYYSMEKLAARWTDGLITMNEEDFEIAHTLPIRINGNIYKVHGVGIDIQKYRIDDAEIRTKTRHKLNLADDDIMILTVAELNQNKNHIQLIKAIAELRETGNVYCFIVGEGKLKQYLHDYVKKKNLEKKVIFLGFRKDVPELLAASDIFCMLSYREGLPRAVMEAMAAGKPVVASNIRGNRDLIKDKMNGFLVPVNNIYATETAILKLVKDENLRISMGNEGKKLIKKYSIETVLEEMSLIYSKFI